MTAVTVRPMRPADIPVIAGWMAASPLWQRYGLSAPTAQTTLETGLQEANILLVADAETTEGRACGVIWCLPEGGFGRSAYIRWLGLREGFTGLGIGAALLRRAEQRAVQYSKDMFLLVSDFNASAQRFYRREGYQQVGAIPGYVLPDVTELVCWKRLSG